MDDERKKQIVLDAWSKGNKIYLEIMKDFVDKLESYSKEVRDFLKFQLSLTPIILAFILSLGVEKLKESTSLGIAIILLLVHFVWQIIYYFFIINSQPITLTAGYRRVSELQKEQLKNERKYLSGDKSITFEQILDSWEHSIKNSDKDEVKKIIISWQMYVLLIIYIVSISLIALTLINWPAFSENMKNFTGLFK